MRSVPFARWRHQRDTVQTQVARGLHARGATHGGTTMANVTATEPREPSALEKHFAELNERTATEGPLTSATIDDVVQAIREVREGAEEQG